MKNIYTRLLNGNSAKELQQMQDCFAANNAELGPEALYPDTKFIVAENDRTFLVAPVQSVYMLGSLGYQEGSNLQLASAMRQIIATLAWESRKQGRGDIYFIGGNEKSDAYAENNDFELVDKPVYRLRLT
jgi:hypothetical protein